MQVLFDLEHSCAVTAVNETDENSIKLYPNPANQTVYVITSEDLNGNAYQILDADGKIVRKGNLGGNKTAVDLGNIPSGIYFLDVNGFAVYKFLKI